MTYIAFTVPGVPVAKGRARSARTKGGKTIHYTPKKTVDYESYITVIAAQKMVSECVINGPVSLHVDLYIPIPRSYSKQKREDALEGKIFPTKKPDCDNILKAITDAMNKIVYHDDSQIVKINMSKTYSTEPRAEIVIQDHVQYAFNMICGLPTKNQLPEALIKLSNLS